MNYITSEELNKIEQDFRDQGFDVAVDCFILNPEGKILTQKRSANRRLYPGCYDFPGGHIDPGDTISSTIIKEIKEETSFDVVGVKKIIQTKDWFVPEDAVREGENNKKKIVQVEIEVESTANPVLEEGKSEAFLWVGLDNIDKLKSNGQVGDYYIYESAKFFLEP